MPPSHTAQDRNWPAPLPPYLCSGRSEGSAEVIYEQAADAEKAMRRYNTVQLDGQPMQVRPSGLGCWQACCAAPIFGAGPPLVLLLQWSAASLLPVLVQHAAAVGVTEGRPWRAEQ